MQVLPLKHQISNDAKNDELYGFLYGFELHKGEGTSVAYETYAVGRHHDAILKEGDAP